MYQVRCPKCRRAMMYHSVKNRFPSKQTKLVKRCVYCNRSFVVHNNLVKIVEGRMIPNKKERLIMVTY